MKTKFYYAGLNLIVPGLGQLAVKRYVRGAIFAMLTIAAIIWCAWEVVMPFMDFYNGDPLSSKMPQMNVVNLLTPALLFLVVFMWSMIDMMFGLKKDEEKK